MRVILAKFHYTGSTGPVRAGLRQSPCGSVLVRAGPVGSGRARVVEFSL